MANPCCTFGCRTVHDEQGEKGWIAAASALTRLIPVFGSAHRACYLCINSMETALRLSHSLLSAYDEQECKASAEEEAQRLENERLAFEERVAPYRKIAAHIIARDFRVTRPQFGLDAMGETAKPWLGDDGLLHFPVMLFYPEAYPYHDVIQDCSEQDFISHHLDEVRPCWCYC
jgi:hypothetical protein